MAKKATKAPANGASPDVSSTKIPGISDLANDVKDLSSKILGDDHCSDVNYWLSTGCTPLDLAISRGLAGGKITEIAGPNASGKTTLALHICKSAQQNGGMAVWLDVEAGFSNSLADDVVGIDRKSAAWVYAQPDSAEQTLFMIEEVARRASQSVLPVAIVVDSMAAMQVKPLAMDSGIDTLETRKPGAVANLISYWFTRGILKMLSGTNIYLVFINQIRSVIDFRSQGGPKWKTPGGESVPFYAGVRLQVHKTAVSADSDKRKLGVMCEVEVIKNKLADTAGRKVAFPIYTRYDQPVRGIDDAMACLSYLAGQGVMKRSGSWYELGGQKKYMSGWRADMLASPDFFNQIRQMVFEAFQREVGLEQ